MKNALFLVFAVAVNFVAGAAVASGIGIDPAIGGMGLNLIACASPLFAPVGLRAGLYTEIWTGEMIKKFRNSTESLGWLAKIRNVSSLVASNNTINFVELGGDPTVLINNTTYPLGIENLEDANKAITLDKYQTKATRISDDQLRGASYDIIGSVLERHEEKISEVKYAKFIHALAPSSNTSRTPVLITTGELSEDGTRKKITRKDLIALKKKYDTQKVPLAGRILVLCPDHVNDLLQDDQKFADQYYNVASGKVMNQYGFEIYEYVDCPYFDVETLTKKAFGSEVDAKVTQASVSFYAPRCVRADGETKTYLSEAKQDTQNQENLVNFRHYSLCLPLTNEAIGAIVSAPGTVTPEIISADTIEFAAAGGTANRTVSATSPWAPSTTDEWLTVSVVSGKLRVVAAANAGAVRTGSVTIALVDNAEISKEIVVTQAASA